MTEVCQIWQDGEAITAHQLFTIASMEKQGRGINGREEQTPNSWKFLPPHTAGLGNNCKRMLQDASNLHGLKEELSMYLKEKLIAHEGLTTKPRSHYSWPHCQQWLSADNRFIPSLCTMQPHVQLQAGQAQPVLTPGSCWWGVSVRQVRKQD